MKLRSFFVAAGVLVVLSGAVWMISTRPSSVIEGAPAAAVSGSGQAKPEVLPKGPSQGVNDPRWPVYLKKWERDPKFEWKTPISFFGKVVDQDQKPISGVEVHLGWNDTSLRGSSEAIRVTDSTGLFAITGISGKILGVDDLIKSDYVKARATNHTTFEYAGFWEPDYHEPDSKKPVVFHMRKKREPAPLLVSQGKIVVEFGKAVFVPMPKGLADGGNKTIEVEVYESDGNTERWRARVAVGGGGIVPALEEFPFEAPEQGYSPEIMLDQDSPQPPGWQAIDEGGWFYIKTSSGYGLLELSQMKGKRTLYYLIRINPTGSRNLEPTPSSPPLSY